MRETQRALTRSLFEKELPDVSPLAINAGHAHDQNQEAALDWWQAGAYSPWTGSGLGGGGATVIDWTAETDICFAPFVLPAGVSRIYPKAKVSTVNLGDRLELHLRIFSPGNLSGTPIDGGRLGVDSYDGATLLNGWVFFDHVDVSALPVTNGQKVGYGLWSAYVAGVGQAGWLHQVSYSLRPGH